jgi:bifunctional non-homologous end joining protein LigD
MLRFVVQRHRARALHYDFRLELNGVLVSWAVPKGPTLDPAVRRAAYRVEDHALSHYDFEGTIGRGDVIVWDAGTWESTEDATAALDQGELHFDLYGEKLEGRFVLIHTRTDKAGKEEWLLLHKRDAYARNGWNPEDHPRSVLTGLTNDEIAGREEDLHS